MPRTKQQTWISYMESLVAHDYDTSGPDLGKISELLAPQQQFHNFFRHSIPATYIVDYTSGQYRAMSDGSRSAMGYHANDFLKGSIGFTISNYHPEDLRLFNEQIFVDRLEILRSIPPEEHHQYVFSYTYRIKSKFGKYVNLLQRNCFVQSDEKGNPLLSMGMVINLDHHCASNPVTQTVEKIGNGTGDASSLISKKHYFLHAEDRFFSIREKEILQWSIEGLSYKEIAAKLYIAEGTVLQHRKNMLKKSKAKNVAEMVAFAIRNNYC